MTFTLPCVPRPTLVGALALTLLSARPVAAQAPASAPPSPPVAPPAPGSPTATPAALPPGAVPMPYPYGAPGSPQPSPQEGLPPYPVPSYFPYPGPQNDAYRLPPPAPRVRKDMGLFVGGVVAVVGGMGAALTGAFLISSAAGRIDVYCDSPSFPCAYKTDGPRMTGGILMMVVGGLAAVAGVPMWAYGSQYVYKPEGEKKAARLPEIDVGLGTASVLVHF